MNNVDKFVKMAEQGKIEESTLVKMADFKEKLKGHSVKEAAGAKAAMGMGKLLLMSAALGAAAPVAGVIEDAVNSYKLSKEKEPSFNKMLEYHPQLKSEDMETVTKYFDSIWHFSPHMAQDPLAAGSYIRSAMQYHNVTGGPTPNMIGDLTSLQKNVQQTNMGSGASRFLDLSKMPMPEILAPAYNL